MYNFIIKNVEVRMSTYFMFGKYSSDAIKEIAASRTEKSQSIISDLGESLLSGIAFYTVPAFSIETFNELSS